MEPECEYFIGTPVILYFMARWGRIYFMCSSISYAAVVNDANLDLDKYYVCLIYRIS